MSRWRPACPGLANPPAIRARAVSQSREKGSRPRPVTQGSAWAVRGAGVSRSGCRRR
ncbi:hypothetical protein HMPREF9946_05077 [Acetobacteraceae bacterium AT-5844]|nr:hypothetical protein HMPREF9946_05077 [Acetobacteraceae bacterium AT-5844]